MTLRQAREFVLHLLGLTSAVALVLWVGTTAATEPKKQESMPSYPAVLFVSNDVSPTYNVPVELNEEPYILIERDSNAVRRHSHHIPPGILLVAVVIAAALLFLLNKRYKDLPAEPKVQAHEKEDPFTGTEMVAMSNAKLGARMKPLPSPDEMEQSDEEGPDYGTSEIVL